jgi:hypothetical protein
MLRSNYAGLLLPVIFTLTCSTTCNPTTPIVAVNPFSDYWKAQFSNLQFTATNNDFPFELGYTFVSTIPGYVLSIGLALPDSGNTYAVTLWDGVTQAVLARDTLEVQHNPGSVGWQYADLRFGNRVVAIQANHLYMVSVNLNPITTLAAGKANTYDYYDIERTDQANIFPLTDGPITFQHEYTTPAYTSTFPTNLSAYQNFLNGGVDIGFYNVVP